MWWVAGTGILVLVEKVRLADKLALFSEHWKPKIVGELNGQHRPVAEREVAVMLFEPATTVNMGDARETERTVKKLDRL